MLKVEEYYCYVMSSSLVSLVEVHRRSGEMDCLNFQGRTARAGRDVCLAYISILEMEAMRYPEMCVKFDQITRRNIQELSIPLSHYLANPKSNNEKVCFISKYAAVCDTVSVL
jgi:hypothetical protein